MYFDWPAGGTLEQLLQMRPLTEAEAKLVFAQVALGVEAAHRQGLVLRDISSLNVHLSKDHQHAQLCPTARANGEKYYESPEIAGQSNKDKKHSQESDVWALGLLLRELTASTPKPNQRD